MNSFLVAALQGVAVKVIESAAGALAERAFGRDSAPAPGAVHQEPIYDPVAEAQAVTDAFLSAIATRDVHALSPLCHPGWTSEPETGPLLDETLRAAPPLSWTYQQWHAPEGWQQGTLPEWLYARLVVTFDLGNGSYDAIPAALRAVYTQQGWLIDHLSWDNPAVEEQHLVSEDLWNAIFAQNVPVDPTTNQPAEEPPPSRINLECAGCRQMLSVPTDKGRLRVTCPRCSNAQWFTP